MPESGSRPRLGLSPTRPQHAAGTRVEPPPSAAWAIGTTPAATRAAAPPDEPPGVRSKFHGLRVGSPRGNSVAGTSPYSGSVLLPSEMVRRDLVEVLSALGRDDEAMKFAREIEDAPSWVRAALSQLFQTE
jgi:hypothetical protein